MAVIVPYQANLGYTQDSVAARPNEESYRVGEQSFARVGKNIMDTGAVIAKANRAYYEEKEKVTEDNAIADAQRRGKENVDKVLVNPDPNDPTVSTNYFDRYMKANQEAKKNFMDSIKDLDESSRARIESKYEKTLAGSWGEALTTHGQMQKRELETIHLSKRNNVLGDISTNPREARMKYDRYAGFITNDSSMPGYVKPGMLSKMKEEAALTAVDSFMRENTDDGYNRAIKIVNEEFADAFDRKSRNDTLDMIDRARAKGAELKIRNDDNIEKQAFEKSVIAHDAQVRSYLNMATDLKNPNIESNPQAFLEAVENDPVLKPQYKIFLSKLAEGKTAQDDPRKKSDFYKRLILRENLGDLRDDIVGAAANEEIKPETAKDLLMQIEEDKKKVGDQRVLALTDPRVRAIVSTLDNQIMSEEEKLLKIKKPETAEMEGRILLDFYDNVKKPEYGGDVAYAMDAALAKNKRGGKLSPKYARLRSETLKDQKTELAMLRKTGQIDDATALEIALELEQMEKEQKGNRDRKDGNQKGKK